MRKLFTGFLILMFISGYSQFLIENVNFELIPQRSVRNYLNHQQSDSVTHFTQLHASCKAKQDFSEFYSHRKEYLIKDDIENVWHTYNLACPVNSWDGRFISFGIMYSRISDKVLYKNYSCSGLEEGQIIYLNLKLLKGIFNLATAFEIIKINAATKTIYFSYLEGGKARGLQTIQLKKTDKGYTKIIHSTEYKSDSKFRDKYLYGHFHKKCIDQFHRNIKRRIRHSNT